VTNLRKRLRTEKERLHILTRQRVPIDTGKCIGPNRQIDQSEERIAKNESEDEKKIEFPPRYLYQVMIRAEPPEKRQTATTDIERPVAIEQPPTRLRRACPKSEIFELLFRHERRITKRKRSKVL